MRSASRAWQRSSSFARMRDRRRSAEAVRDSGALQHPDLALLRAKLTAHVSGFVAHPVELHSALRSSGTSPNFRISLASLKSPAGRVARPTERDGAGVTRLPGERLGSHYCGVGVEAFGRLSGGHNSVGEEEPLGLIPLGRLLAIAITRWPSVAALRVRASGLTRSIAGRARMSLLGAHGMHFMSRRVSRSSRVTLFGLSSASRDPASCSTRLAQMPPEVFL